MKKALIIVYYWPPSGGSGVQRWVKFAKHLRSFGWEPIIYTPENPFVQETDISLLGEIPEGIEVLRSPVLEMQKYFGYVSATNTSNSSPNCFARLKKRIGNFIRGNFFIPDARITWVKPSVKYLSSYLSRNKVDVIVSSGPPHSLHLIALTLKKKFNLPWLADFRDPWLEILDFHGFTVSEKAFNKHQALFNEVLSYADSVVVAHPTVQQDFQQQSNKSVICITNGYDQEDFLPKSAEHTLELDSEKYKVVFVGILYDILNSPSLWRAIHEKVKLDRHFATKLELIFVGKVHAAAMQNLKEFELLSFCTFTGYVNHDVAIEYEKAADLLLLLTPSSVQFKYVIPGKLFEYMASGKPILCTARPDNDTAKILLDCDAGMVIHPDDFQGILSALSIQGNAHADEDKVKQYERRNLTAELAKEMNRISEIS